jgi:hypothetical protein
MKIPVVYRGDMRFGRPSDRDIERLLAGEAPHDAELAELLPLVRALRTEASRPPSDPAVEQLAASASEIVRRTRSTEATTPERRVVPSRPTRTTTMRWRLAAGLAAVMILGGATGVVAAADGSAPGSPLYGLDRALEVVGLGAGGAHERLQEASALAHGGQDADAVEHAADAIAQNPDPVNEAALEALSTVADKLRSIEQGSEHADQVRQRVAAMLDWMASTDVRGRDFGQTVADMAQGISDGGASGNEGGPPDDVPAGPPDDVPAGPPDDVPAGPPDDTPGNGPSGNGG